MGNTPSRLADVNGVYGSPRLHYTAKKIGIKPLVGAEVGLPSRGRLTLLVESQTGYKNLTQLITWTKLRNGINGKIENPFAVPEDLAVYKTMNGAQAGDLFMSLIHTCELCGQTLSSTWQSCRNTLRNWL